MRRRSICRRRTKSINRCIVVLSSLDYVWQRNVVWLIRILVSLLTVCIRRGSKVNLHSMTVWPRNASSGGTVLVECSWSGQLQGVPLSSWSCSAIPVLNSCRNGLQTSAQAISWHWYFFSTTVTVGCWRRLLLFWLPDHEHGPMYRLSSA
jgi:hypothetical protein